MYRAPEVEVFHGKYTEGDCPACGAICRSLDRDPVMPCLSCHGTVALPWADEGWFIKTRPPYPPDPWGPYDTEAEAEAAADAEG